MSLVSTIIIATISGEKLNPQIKESERYKYWVSIEDGRRCIICERLHGKIWLVSEKPSSEPPKHFKCRCRIEKMKAIVAGTATINGTNGADWTLKYKKTLPNYYVTRAEAEAHGWRRGKNPSDFIPNKMITAGIYHNDDGHLPSAKGRIWYEADINYKTGKRNSQRILWSNDGLIFVTYDHYKTFYEII